MKPDSPMSGIGRLLATAIRDLGHQAQLCRRQIRDDHDLNQIPLREHRARKPNTPGIELTVEDSGISDTRESDRAP